MSAFSLAAAPPEAFAPDSTPNCNAPLPTFKGEPLKAPELRYAVYRQSLSARDRSMSQLLRTV